MTVPGLVLYHCKKTFSHYHSILNYISVFRLKRMEEDAEREREAKEEEERMAKQRAEVLN
jgi:hypothetical protein